MTSGTQLMQYVSDLRDYLGSPEVASETGIGNEAVLRLYGGDIDLLSAPGLGVMLMVPQPTVEQRLAFGDNALHVWHVLIIAKAAPLSNTEQTLMAALDALGAIRRRLARAGNPFYQLEPATPLYEIYDTNPTTTIAALTYDLNWPL